MTENWQIIIQPPPSLLCQPVIMVVPIERRKRPLFVLLLFFLGKGGEITVSDLFPKEKKKREKHTPGMEKKKNAWRYYTCGVWNIYVLM